MTRFVCLMVILTVLATRLAAQEPHILFCTQWGRPGKIDFEYMRELDADGFTVDFTEHWTELTAERASKYHVLVIPGWVWMKNKEVFSHVGIPTRGGPDPEELRVLVRNHLEAGGGVLLAASRIGASRDCWERYNQMLAEYGARLPMERIEAPSETMARHPRLHGFPFCYTRNIATSPVSDGVNGVWWPNHDRGRIHNYIRYSGPIIVDDSWQVVLRAPKGSRTIQHVPRAIDQINPNDLIENPHLRDEGVPEPPLLAIRDKGSGRLALYHCLNVFHLGSGTSWLHDGAMLDKGLDGKPSDFNRLLRNTLRWLAEPALRDGKLGGAKIPDERLVPKVMTEWGRTRFGDPRYPTRLEPPDRPFHERPLLRGLVGARTALSGGTGSVLDYAQAAKDAGLDFVVFLEDFRELTRTEIDQLVADCRAASSPELGLIPGFRMATNLHIQIAFFGDRPLWPEDYVLSRRVPGAFRLQGETADGKYTQSKNEALDFNLGHFMGRGLAEVNNIVFFDFTRHAENGAPQLEHCRIFGGGGIVFYEDGELVEDVTQQYLRTNAGTMSCVPVAIDLVDSPAALRQAVADGHALTYVAARDALQIMRDGLHKNSQFDGPPVSVSSGPQIVLWPRTNSRVVFGADRFCAGLGAVDVELSVKAEAGLSEITIFDGERLWRRFLTDGREFKTRLYLDAFRQRTMSVVATDQNGGRAVSFPMQTWKHGAAHHVLYCGDHVNHCTSVNMKMARGPMTWPIVALPPVAAAGFTWDGGPQPYQPIVDWPGVSPNLQTKEKIVQNQRPYQYPALVFADEGCYRGKSVMVGQCRVRGNPWSGWGPIDPTPLVTGWSVYTELARYVEGADPMMWGGPGLERGSITSLYEHELTFVRQANFQRFRLTYTWRKPTEHLKPTFVVGRGAEVIAEHPCVATGEWENQQRYTIPTGGWFAGTARHGGNCFLTVNRGTPLAFDISGKMAALDVDFPKVGLSVAKGDTHRAEILTIVWPLSVPIPDAAALRRAIAWLRHPTGLEVSRGELPAGQSPGLIEIAARDHVAEYTLPAPPEEVPSTTLAVRVEGLNPNWDAGLWQRRGYAGSGNYHDGCKVYTTLGLDEAGRAYVPVYAQKAPLTDHVVGHPVVADDAGRDLFITAIPLNGPYPSGEKDQPGWHVSVNNPTDAPIETTVRQAFPAPGLDLPKIRLTLNPGEYRVLKHQQPKID